MELELIAWLRDRLPPHQAMIVGPGIDDAAVLRSDAWNGCVVTADLLTDGVDFELANIDPRRAGRKALAVNLSDMAAMAAQPVAAVITLALPRSGGVDLAKQFYEGLIPLAEKYDVALAGGDTNAWDAPLVISVTLLGTPSAAGPLTRRGAQVGDAIVVTGKFGGSILGHHLDFEPRVAEALELVANYPVHAGIDVSDGLSLDLSRVCAESGCGAVVETGAIPLAKAAGEIALQRNDGSTALSHALGDGEDFELVLAMPQAAAQELVARQPLACGCTCIGQFVADEGLWQVDSRGARVSLPVRGFEHRFDT